MAVTYVENTGFSTDGTEIFIRRWSPSDTAKQAELLVAHGYGEYGERYRELAHNLGEHGIATTSFDFRGHGKSTGARGHVERFHDYHTDLEIGLKFVGDGPRFLLGHSQGGLISLDFVASKKPKLNGLIVTNPFLALQMPPPKLRLWLARTLANVTPRLRVPVGLSATVLSRDESIVEEYMRDPLVHGYATPRWNQEVETAQARVRATTAIDPPLLYVYSDADQLASPAANRTLAEQISCADKTVWERHDEFHEVLNELDRKTLHQQIGEWICQHCD